MPSVLAAQIMFGRNDMLLESFSGSELLFYSGIGLMALAVAIGLVSLIILRISGKQLKQKLEKEYGKKRH